jgi:hypothetical protein
MLREIVFDALSLDGALVIGKIGTPSLWPQKHFFWFSSELGYFIVLNAAKLKFSKFKVSAHSVVMAKNESQNKKTFAVAGDIAPYMYIVDMLDFNIKNYRTSWGRAVPSSG